MGGEVPLYYKSTTKSIDDVKGKEYWEKTFLI